MQSNIIQCSTWALPRTRIRQQMAAYAHHCKLPGRHLQGPPPKSTAAAMIIPPWKLKAQDLLVFSLHPAPLQACSPSTDVVPLHHWPGACVGSLIRAGPSVHSQHATPSPD
ncbi:hypothetical protein J3E69DRAFT_330780 [Trichoderma sp. SZMC 28015]